MNLINATKLLASYTMGMEPSGKELLLVVVKGTFDIPAYGGVATLSGTQVPMIEADTFFGKPGESAIMYESDYAPYKAKCDVLVLGSAYAPTGNKVTKVTVGLQIGPIRKQFNVIGNRLWKDNLFSRPEPFERMPISYSNAFGGMDKTHPNEKKHTAYWPNPVGVGHHSNTSDGNWRECPLPNTEELTHPITKPDGNYKPMALTPLPRHAKPRLDYAGTYDKNWLECDFPFLPKDFDPRYYQAAPEDQQMPYPIGGEEVILYNLSSRATTIRFKLPKLDIPIEFTRQDSRRVQDSMRIDTIVIEPDENRFTLCWRANLPLHRDIFEVKEAVVGTMPRAWKRARDIGKTYYKSLGALVRERRQQ